jgi:hypothetical protein
MVIAGSRGDFISKIQYVLEWKSKSNINTVLSRLRFCVRFLFLFCIMFLYKIELDFLSNVGSESEVRKRNAGSEISVRVGVGKNPVLLRRRDQIDPSFLFFFCRVYVMRMTRSLSISLFLHLKQPQTPNPIFMP